MLNSPPLCVAASGRFFGQQHAVVVGALLLPASPQADQVQY